MLYLLYPPDPRTEAATMREGAALPARGDHDQHVPAAQLVADAKRTCGSPTGWPSRPRAACSSPPAAISTATSSGTISSRRRELIQLKRYPASHLRNHATRSPICPIADLSTSDPPQRSGYITESRARPKSGDVSQSACSPAGVRPTDFDNLCYRGTEKRGREQKIGR